MKALLICPYFGDKPSWWSRYESEEIPRLAAQGYDMLLDWDEDSFRDRVHAVLGITPPRMWGTGKIWDFRPALGALYEEEASGYDWWGHTDFDCVYGRVVPMESIAEYDAYTDCAYNYMAGPWSLYRNVAPLREAFTAVPDWRENMEAAEPTAWCETTFSEALGKRFDVAVASEHAYTSPELLRRDGDRLLHGGREISFFHFRRTKEWPL